MVNQEGQEWAEGQEYKCVWRNGKAAFIKKGDSNNG